MSEVTDWLSEFTLANHTTDNGESSSGTSGKPSVGTSEDSSSSGQADAAQAGGSGLASSAPAASSTADGWVIILRYHYMGPTAITDCSSWLEFYGFCSRDFYCSWQYTNIYNKSLVL